MQEWEAARQAWETQWGRLWREQDGARRAAAQRAAEEAARRERLSAEARRAAEARLAEVTNSESSSGSSVPAYRLPPSPAPNEGPLTAYRAPARSALAPLPPARSLLCASAHPPWPACFAPAVGAAPPSPPALLSPPVHAGAAVSSK